MKCHDHGPIRIVQIYMKTYKRQEKQNQYNNSSNKNSRSNLHPKGKPQLILKLRYHNFILEIHECEEKLRYILGFYFQIETLDF